MTTIVVGAAPVLVGDIMSAPALTVPATATLREAWRLMMASGLRHLVVAHDGQVVGMIDDRAVFAQWPMGPLALRRNLVGELMRRRVRCVEADTEVSEVAAVMVEDGVDAVPVIDGDGTVVGIVTTSDLTHAAAAYGMCRPD